MRLLILALALLAQPAKAALTGLSTLPGGSLGQVQYSSGSFAGAVGSLVNSTGTIKARELRADYGITVGTAVVRGALSAGSISGTVSAGSVDLSTVTVAINNVGASTQTLANSVGVSTATLTSLVVAVGGSTQTLANAVGQSTATLAELIGMTSGQMLTEATTYVNVTGDSMTGPLTVANLVGPLTVTSGSMTVTQAWLGQTSSSAPVMYLGTNGSASAPSLSGPRINQGLSFASAGDDDDMNFVVNGTVRGVAKDGVGLCGGSGQSTGQPCLRSSAGSKSDPSFQYVSDGNTGIYRSGADDMRLSAGGVDTIRNTATEVNIFPAGVSAASFTATGLAMGGAAAYIMSGTSITTSGGFFGDGSGITNISGSGKLKQYVSSTTVAFWADVATAIPWDDSIPQQGAEGMLLLNSTFTPTNAANYIVAELDITWCEPADDCTQGTVAFFKDLGQDALCSAGFSAADAAGVTRHMHVTCELETAGSTTARNYTVKIGANGANCIAVNGCSARKYGGSAKTTFTLKEIAP